MGTMLHAGGVSLDRCLPELNVSRPELVRAIHEAYIAAGADLVETNTFGASRLRLSRFGMEDRATEINTAGVRVARDARESAGLPTLIAGSVGPVRPSGFRGRLDSAELRAVLREQIEALASAGVDLLVLETFGELGEMGEAVSIARETALPVIAQMTFSEAGRTISGDSSEDVATTLEKLGVAVIGANCTLGPQGLQDVIRELARYTSLPLSAQPNAGSPRMVEGRFEYTTHVDYFGRCARELVELGAAIVGGCCGTTPAHIQATAQVVSGMQVATRKVVRSGTRLTSDAASEELPGHLENRFAEQIRRRTFVVACEVYPPSAGDSEKVISDASSLKEAGADVLVAGPAGGGRAHMSPVSLGLLLQQRLGIETILTVLTWDKSLSALQADLLGAYALGIRTVICRTGTPPPQGDYPHPRSLWDVESIGLIEVLRSLNEGRDCNGIPIRHPTDFCKGARVNASAGNLDIEVARARRRLKAGADFLVTRPVYDLRALDAFLAALGPIDVPVLMGIMPLRDFRHAEYLQHEVPDVVLPEAVLERMWNAGKAAPELGIEIAAELVAGARARVQGILASSESGSAAETAQLLCALSS